MNRFDFTPYRRTTVGFDRLFDLLENQARAAQGDNYPPFNIERSTDDAYRVTIAVAGFKSDELDITAQQNLLVVSGRKAAEAESRGNFLHMGIANRNFERRFELADFVRVSDASLEDGLLTIDLVREVPEAMKPKKISINGAPRLSVVEGAAKEDGDSKAA
ncbi:Hsp20 family protein [Blastomonas sp. AAP53]|uniref:Hsp20 family protein n=1 Tax=Blastomonas sp. AAP53 TaxID=1248760 RepID=UPI00031563D7|nr:Hsp20 family protein [Blastomonas sp. AAP53]